MKLVHNSDKKKIFAILLSHVVVILYYFPWVKISVLSSQHIIQVFRHEYALVLYLYICVFWKVLPF
jgi:hypothetical protein